MWKICDTSSITFLARARYGLKEQSCSVHVGTILMIASLAFHLFKDSTFLGHELAQHSTIAQQQALQTCLLATCAPILPTPLLLPPVVLGENHQANEWL